jgi:hypothetical protein
MLFLDAVTQQRAALLDGHILLWDPSQVGGTTFWGLPNQAPFYPPLMLATVLTGAIEALNATLFLHVLWGALGIYALVFRLGGRQFAALIGGLLYAYAVFTRTMVDVLPLEALASAFIPWAMYCLARTLTAPEQDHAAPMGGAPVKGAPAKLAPERWAPLQWAVLAGIAYAAVPWLGGFIQFLPGLVVIGTVVLIAVLRNPSRERLRRGALGLLVFGLTMSVISAGKLLPMWHWIALTDRAGGITEEFALGGALLGEQMLEYSLREGWTPWVLLACGLVAGAWRRTSWSLPFAAAVAVLLLIANGSLYKLLYDYVPGFAYVREPRRVWMLMPAVLPVAAGLGLAQLQDLLRLTPRRAALAGGIVLLAVAADMIGWSRYEPPRRQSVSERVAANELHLDLARRAREEPRFRVIDYGKARARVKNSADLMRSTLGLESIEGILGNVSIQAFDIDYLNCIRNVRPKMLGVMNTRYVTSALPLDIPDLKLVTRFTPDPDRIAKGMDGPLLYRNELALPRASLADHALLQVGGTADQQQLLLVKGIWNPRRTVLVRAEPAELARLPDADLQRFDGAVLCVEDAALAARLEAAGVSCYRLTARGDLRTTPMPEEEALALREWHQKVLAASTTPMQAIADPPREWNGQHVALPEPLGVPEGAVGRWLVLAETFATYPGWTAEVDGVPTPLFVANAVTTAVPLPPGAREVVLDYMPPGLVSGLAITGAGLLLAGIVLARRPRAPAR